MVRMAALFVAISGVLRLLAPIVGGFAQEAVVLAVLGLVWLLAAAGLRRGLRWLAWLAFFATMAGAIAALASAVSITVAPQWLYWSIAACDTLAAIMLFGVLWAPNKAVK